MKNVIIAFSILLFSDCTPEDFVEDNERNLIVGSVINQEGSPLEGISIKSAYDLNDFLEFGQGSLSNLDPILGQSTTDSNGEFEFISLTARNTGKLNYFVISDNENSLLQRVIYLLDLPFTGEVELPETTLRPEAQFTIEIDRVSTEATSLFYNIVYDARDEVFFLSDGSGLPPLETTRQLDVSQNEGSLTLSSIVGGTVIFSYAIFNEGEAAGQGTETIVISEQSQTFNFEF